MHSRDRHSLRLQNLPQMPQPKSAHPNTPQLPPFTAPPQFLLHIAHSPPALPARLHAPQRAMYQVQINIAQPAHVQRALDRRTHIRVAIIKLELGSVEDGRACCGGGAAKVEDGLPDLALVFVPGGRVLYVRGGLFRCVG